MNYDFETLPVARLPVELFREIVKYLPETQVVHLRLVCQSWREFLDYDFWTARLLCWKSDTTCLHKPLSQVATRLNEVSQHLRYLDLELCEKGLEPTQVSVCHRLRTLKLRHVATQPVHFSKLCTGLPTLGLRHLGLFDLSWAELENFHAILPTFCTLSSLELYMRLAIHDETEEAFDRIQNYGMDEGRQFEHHRIPGYSLPSLRHLTFDYLVTNTRYTVTGGMESDMYGSLHTHLVSILLAATNITDLSIHSHLDKNVDLSELYGDVETYSRLIPELGETHKLLKRGTFERVALSTWLLNYLEELTLIDVSPGPLLADEYLPSMSASPLQRLDLKWTKSGYEAELTEQDVPFSRSMIEYRTSGGPGTGIAGFLKILRELKVPVESMRHMSLEAVHDKNRNASDFFDDHDFKLIVRFFPQLRSMKLVDYLNTQNAPEDILRAGLPFLQSLEIVRLD